MAAVCQYGRCFPTLSPAGCRRCVLPPARPGPSEATGSLLLLQGEVALARAPHTPSPGVARLDSHPFMRLQTAAPGRQVELCPCY